MKTGFKELVEKHRAWRERDANRCRSCGYDCASLPERAPCPECGEPEPLAPANPWKDGRFPLGWLMVIFQTPFFLMLTSFLPTGRHRRGVQPERVNDLLFRELGLLNPGGTQRALWIIPLMYLGPLALLATGVFLAQAGCKRKQSAAYRTMIFSAPGVVAFVVLELMR